jgi:hypothetical protein
MNYVSLPDLIRQSRRLLPSVLKLPLDPRDKPEDDTRRIQSLNRRFMLWHNLYPNVSLPDLIRQSRAALCFAMDSLLDSGFCWNDEDEIFLFQGAFS